MYRGIPLKPIVSGRFLLVTVWSGTERRWYSNAEDEGNYPELVLRALHTQMG